MKFNVRLTIIATAFLFQASLAFAGVEASNCVECSLPSTKSREQMLARDIRNTVSNGQVAQAVSDVQERMNWAETCGKFSNGSSYGPWGQEVIKQLQSRQYSELERGSRDLKELCPGYEQMSPEGKQGMWVTIIAAMSNHESSCRKSPPLHGGPNGTLVGLLQLHKGREGEYSGGCRNGDGSTAEGSIKCSMAMLNDQLGRGEDLFTRSPYWEVLKVTSRKKIYLEIQEAVQAYSLCK
ncbi:hypothetical protein [Bdellovibrio sp. NC01]|uniref:hypothetical protein n=1 Tax=Bdellovibrio sp. NC01 TaxID=2220073 RepID=UPI001156E176|nr:hypothetical protein [Bdellovibrio sp. NC01]QDK36535.1 hypothetical protein DOE51_02430 [Bdellovibrio sp. NC01]